MGFPLSLGSLECKCAELALLTLSCLSPPQVDSSCPFILGVGARREYTGVQICKGKVRYLASSSPAACLIDTRQGLSVNQGLVL